MAAATRPCNTREPAKVRPSLSLSMYSPWPSWKFVAMTPSSRFQRLGDDADVGDAGLFDGIHHRGEGAEGHTLVGPEVDDAFGVGFAGGFQQGGELVDVDWFVLQEDVLLAVDGDDHAFFGELIDGTRFRNRHLNA